MRKLIRYILLCKKRLKDHSKFNLSLFLVTVFICYGCSQPNRLAFESPNELKSYLTYQVTQVPILSSHRGGPTVGFPENCIATFENTLKYNYSIMEIDPRYTKDSMVVLMHDATIDRTTSGQGKVADYTYEELQQFRLKGINGDATKFKIPTLNEVLEWSSKNTLLILDMKTVPTKDRVKHIQMMKAQSSALIMMYNDEDAKLCYELDPDIMMEVFIPTIERAKEFESTGVPWNNVVAFVSHELQDNNPVFEYLHERGVLCIVGSSRNYDKAYASGEVTLEELHKGYEGIIAQGADMIEADLGVEAGKFLAGKYGKNDPE